MDNFLKLILKFFICYIYLFIYLLELTFFFFSSSLKRISLFINEPYILATVIMMLHLMTVLNVGI